MIDLSQVWCSPIVISWSGRVIGDGNSSFFIFPLSHAWLIHTGGEDSESHLRCCVKGPGEVGWVRKPLRQTRGRKRKDTCHMQPHGEMQLSACQTCDFSNNINAILVFRQALYKGPLLPKKKYNDNNFKLMRGKNTDFLLHENASGPTPLLFWPLSLPSCRSRDGSQAGLRA